MKNYVKWLGLIALVAVIGVSLAACGNVKLEGTSWKQSDGKDDWTLVFSSPPNMTVHDGPDRERGTYAVSGKKVTIMVDGETVTGTISGNTLTLSDDGVVGDTYTFTKQ